MFASHSELVRLGLSQVGFGSLVTSLSLFEFALISENYLLHPLVLFLHLFEFDARVEVALFEVLGTHVSLKILYFTFLQSPRKQRLILFNLSFQICCRYCLPYRNCFFGLFSIICLLLAEFVFVGGVEIQLLIKSK